MKATMAATTNLLLTAATGASGAALSFAAAEPLYQVFNFTGLTMACMGALGGMTFAMVDRAQWREGVRQALIGALLAFGLGVLGPPIISRMMGAEILGSAGTIQGLGAAAYLVGFAQERVATWLLLVRGGDDGK